MSAASKIEWTDATWNPTRGCAKKSAECANCYAMAIAHRFSGDGQPYEGLTRMIGGRAQWTGEARFVWHMLEEPLSWRKPRRIFVDSMSDVFHDDIADSEIALVFGTAIAAVHLRGHIFTILTKRPERMQLLLSSDAFWEEVNDAASMHVMERIDPLDRRQDDARATLDDYGPENPPPGIWLGVSVGDQATADERREFLRATPATVRIVSYEPAIGPVDWTGWEFIDQLISGGESGPYARPSYPSWHRAARDFCAAHGRAYFFKQWGEWGPLNDHLYASDQALKIVTDKTLLLVRDAGESAEDMARFGKRVNGRLLDGREHNEFPAVSA